MVCELKSLIQGILTWIAPLRLERERQILPLRDATRKKWREKVKKSSRPISSVVEHLNRCVKVGTECWLTVDEMDSLTASTSGDGEIVKGVSPRKQ